MSIALVAMDRTKNLSIMYHSSTMDRTELSIVILVMFSNGQDKEFEYNVTFLLECWYHSSKSNGQDKESELMYTF